MPQIRDTSQGPETVSLSLPGVPMEIRDWLKREAIRRNATVSSVVVDAVKVLQAHMAEAALRDGPPPEPHAEDDPGVEVSL